MRALGLLLLAALFFATPSLASVQSGPRQQVTGNCNVTMISVTIQGNVEVCTNDPRELRSIKSAINQAISQGRVSRQELARLVSLINRALAQNAQNAAAINDLADRVYVLENGRNVNFVIADIEQLLTSRSSAVGYVGHIKITLERVAAGYGVYSIYLLVENEGISERSITLFGEGAFGNGGSSIIARGQEVRAAGIEFAGVARQELVERTVIPGVPLRVRVDFTGIHVPPGELAVFQLAHSYQNMRPDGRVTFRFNGS